MITKPMKNLLVLVASLVHLSTATKILVACTPNEVRRNEDCEAFISYPETDALPSSVEAIISKKMEACVQAATGDKHNRLKLPRYVSDDPGRSLRQSRQAQDCSYGGCNENICENCEVCCGVVQCSYCVAWGFDCSQAQCENRRQAEEIEAVLDPSERSLRATVQKIESLCTADVKSLVRDLNARFQNECLGTPDGLECKVLSYED